MLFIKLRSVFQTELIPKIKIKIETTILKLSLTYSEFYFFDVFQQFNLKNEKIFFKIKNGLLLLSCWNAEKIKYLIFAFSSISSL